MDFSEILSYRPSTDLNDLTRSGAAAEGWLLCLPHMSSSQPVQCWRATVSLSNARVASAHAPPLSVTMLA
jgi:hypothetical protein